MSFTVQSSLGSSVFHSSIAAYSAKVPLPLGNSGYTEAKRISSGHVTPAGVLDMKAALLQEALQDMGIIRTCIMENEKLNTLD